MRGMSTETVPQRLNAEQRAEIDALRAQRAETRRPTVPALEEALYQAMPVLDHGFVRVVDYMGDDAAIVQSARVSYGRGTKQSRQDAGLIRYLMRHAHTTPFEMCEIKFHVKLPIFVARQWIRHRTANVNEYSARYSILDREFYLPDPDRVAAQSAANRQGRGEPLPPDEARRLLDLLREDAERAYDHYEHMLNERQDGAVIDPSRTRLSRELARIGLPLSAYTQWYWKTDLHNLFRFIELRADPHAQYEIRAYAEVIADLVRLWVPLAYDAFADYRAGGARLSAKGLTVVKRMLAGEHVAQEDSGMSRAEWRELMRALDRDEA